MIVAETGERLSSRDTNGGRRGSKSTAVSGKIRQKLLPEQPAWAGHPDGEPATESAPLLQGQSTGTEQASSSWKAAVALAKTIFDSRTTKDVLKCAITYFVASLVVFTPLGTAIYGKSDNKHLVCTVSVYFHPARTLGSMAEAVKFVLISLSYSLVVAILSMETSAAFLSHGWRLWGYAIDLIVFCGGGLGLIAYAKQYVGKPTFNTACSLASIFLVTILTKEGNIQAGRLSLSKLLQSFMLVFSGAGLACFMCIAAWPQRAESELKIALNKAMDVYGEALEFALGKLLECERVDPVEFDKFTSDINASFEKTRKHLADARYELLLSGRESEYLLLERIVTSAQRLGLHLSGLVSSCDIQWNLLSMLVEGDMSSTTSSDDAEHEHDRRPSARSSGSYGAMETSTRSLEDERFISTSAASTTRIPSENDLPYELLREFLSFVGPPMHSFVSTLRQMMDNLPFDDSPRHRVSLHKQYRNSLQLALDLFSATREDALAKMYSQESFRAARDFDDAVAEEAVAASCGNFSFVLEDFGEELRTFVDALSEYAELTESGKPKVFFKQ